MLSLSCSSQKTSRGHSQLFFSECGKKGSLNTLIQSAHAIILVIGALTLQQSTVCSFKL